MTKQHIINEIRRTAKENGRVALGKARFFNETGIKESDWSGRFWVRWSDAFREAGFEPNEKRTAYDESMLIKKFVALVRELGHFPVAAELRMKDTRDPTFPNAKTFARFGLKHELAAKVRSYCEARAGYEDVASMCALIAPKAVAIDEGAEDGEPPFGFVYLMKSGRNYKIGRSNSVGRREYELGILLPEPASTVHKIATDDPVGIEAYWHGRFTAKRKNGEWFELDASDVKAESSCKPGKRA